MKVHLSLILLAGIAWSGLWLTPDQLGQRQLNRGEFEAAATSFRDPMWQGVAWFRAGEFEKAERSFARVATPEAEYNRGNCLIMRGKYEEAIERFDRALELRPDWEQAQVNREIAIARAKVVKRTGGDMGDQKVGADDTVFDRNKTSDGQATETEGNPLSDAAMQALWLRRVQTKPADFLKAKFAYQLADEQQQDPAP